MKLYIKQKVFSWGDKFTVKDESGEDRYLVEGELFSWGKKLHVYDMTGREILFIKQEVLSWLPRYQIFCDGRLTGEIRKEFTFFSPKYTIDGLGWEIEGHFLAHDYQITRDDWEVAAIAKVWMSWGDSYELNILNPEDELMALAVVLTIDCVMDSNSSAAVTISSS